MNVTYHTKHNIYQYDNRNLIISYATALVLTFLGVGIGAFSFLDNGVAHSTAFSAVLVTTRNLTLDEMTVGQSLGAVPLDDDIARVRLRFGEIAGKGEGVRRVGFGLEGSVGEIYKGGKYV